MVAPKLYRGEPGSAAEQILRDVLLQQRQRLILELAAEPDLGKLVEYQSRAKVILGLEEDIRKIVMEAAPKGPPR